MQQVIIVTRNITVFIFCVCLGWQSRWYCSCIINTASLLDQHLS